MKCLALILTIFIVSKASAGVFGELNLFYNTDSFKTATTSSSGKTFFALDVYANLETKHRYFAGFHVDSISLTDTTATGTETFSSQNMGPMFLWVMDKRKIYSLALGYNLVAKASYNAGTGGEAEALTGTGIFATVAAMPEVSENFFVGLKLNYHSLSFSKSTVSTTATDVSYNRTLIFPSISVAWRN